MSLGYVEIEPRADAQQAPEMWFWRSANLG